MASSAGGGGGARCSPPAATTAAAPRVVMESLIEVQEGATRLQTMLEESPTPSMAAAAAGTTSEIKQTIGGMMSSLSSAMSALETTGGGTGAAQGPGQGRRIRRRGGAAAGSGSGPQRRSSTARRRSYSPFVETVTARTLNNDGNSWRKYGQKRIHESPNPRSYYRCTHRPDQGCRATRQVQVSDTNPSEFIISYFGQHTCQDPSTIPIVIADTAPPPEDCANLISFGGGGSSTVGGGESTMLLSRFCGYSSSLPSSQAQDYRCGSEEALSSSSPAAAQLGAAPVQVGSAGTMITSSATVGSAPAEYWPGGTSDMACDPGTATSFPSSPSSLGFMTGSPFGSFGNAGDDDLFSFDP